jgi:uncharacterized protein YodC (DUF2158 family)
MLAFTKRRSVAIAAALGIALAVPLSISAFADSAPPKTAAQNRAASPLKTGDLVHLRSGGPLMTVTGVRGDQVNCSWIDWLDGQPKTGSFPTAVLAAPVTLPAGGDSFIRADEQLADQHYRKHCLSGSLSIEGKFICSY